MAELADALDSRVASRTAESAVFEVIVAFYTARFSRLVWPFSAALRTNADKQMRWIKYPENAKVLRFAHHLKNHCSGTRTFFDVAIFQLPPTFVSVKFCTSSPMGIRYVTVLVFASSLGLLARIMGMASITI